jgi:hypothetical protein
MFVFILSNNWTNTKLLLRLNCDWMMINDALALYLSLQGCRKKKEHYTINYSKGSFQPGESGNISLTYPVV